MCSGIQPPTPDKHRLKGIITVNSKQLCRLEVVTQFVTLKPTWKLKAPGFSLLHYRQFTISGLLFQLSLLKLFPLLCSVVLILCMQDVVFFQPCKISLTGWGAEGRRQKMSYCLQDCPWARSQGQINMNISTSEHIPAAPGLGNRGKSCAFQQQIIKLAQLCCSTTAGDVKADLKL